MFTRIIIIVMDSVGIGALPDASTYGDFGVNTLGNIARSQGGLFLPVLEKMGLGCIEPIQGIKQTLHPLASFGKMAEISKVKDTIGGHWEMAGCPVFNPFPVYPNGFPADVIENFIKYTGKNILGNKPASGITIMEELGQQHLATGYPIVYTSADSVFQIAAHEEIIPLEELYQLCMVTRTKVCIGEHAVGRVIARPFRGSPGEFVRTANRHDYSIEPPLPTILDKMKEAGYMVTGIGKIADIFAHRGLTQSLPTTSNNHGMEILTKLVQQCTKSGLIMANLVDFDSVFGHRNDVAGYAQALETFDQQLGNLLDVITENDLVIVTADHGCDPTTAGTDHTREYVPLLAYACGGRGNNLGVRATFADIGATIAENFTLPALPYGQSFLRQVVT